MSFQGNHPVMFGGGVSMVTTSLGTNDPELGSRCTVDGRQYVFVYNGGGEQASPGYGVVPNSATTGYTVTVSAATSADICIGVVYNATLTTGTYGWVVTRGVVPVTMGGTSGTVAARGLIEIGANGVFVPVSNTTGNKSPPVGVALAAIVSSASGSAYISCY